MYFILYSIKTISPQTVITQSLINSYTAQQWVGVYINFVFQVAEIWLATEKCTFHWLTKSSEVPAVKLDEGQICSGAQKGQGLKLNVTRISLSLVRISLCTSDLFPPGVLMLLLSRTLNTPRIWLAQDRSNAHFWTNQMGQGCKMTQNTIVHSGAFRWV